MPFINIRWILFVAAVAVMGSAAAAIDSTAPSPMASINVANTLTSEDQIIEWLKLTAVPFGVFLFGACTWGCIKNSPAWRDLTGREGESDARQTVQSQASEQSIDYNINASDLEKGRESSHRCVDEGLAMSAQTLQTMLQPPRECPNGEEGNGSTDVAPQL